MLGASFDTVEQNAAFARKLGVAFPLLCDVDRAVALAYGACPDRRSRNPERMSFLIDEAGRIERVYPRVDPRDHPARVLADVMKV